MTEDSRDEAQLRAIREDLYRRFDDLSTVEALFDFQLVLIEEIKAAERAIATDKNSPERVHRHLVRLIGDALAFTQLHPYTIRQLSHDSGSPPNLSNQAGLQLTVEAAEEATSRGYPALISDITYVLGTADVVAVAHPEHPILIECGGNPRYFNRGRKKRQTERANAALTQLREGINHWPDRAIPTATVELDVEPSNVFPQLETAIGRAHETKGCSTVHVGDKQFVFAVDAAVDLEDARIVADDFDLDGYAIAFSEIHERRRNPRIAPPHFWPISAETRQAIIEGEVIVGHALNAMALVGLSSGEAEIQSLHPHEGVFWARILHKGVPFVVGPGVFAEALGNYQSFDSTAELIFATFEAVEERAQESPEPSPTEGPDLARRLRLEITEQGRPADPTLQLPPNLLSEFLEGLEGEER